jgi:hypothetical protein
MALDAATISAFAAAAAAMAAATVAGIQLYIGHRQTEAELIAAQAAMMNAESIGRHTVAAFRQKWIECVRDALCEYQSILMSLNEDERVSADDRKLAALKTKLELLLNPEEPDAQHLLAKINDLRVVDSPKERLKTDEALSALAHKILKTEWVRIKDELRERKPR